MHVVVGSFSIFKIYLFIYLFWLCWVFVAARGLSLIAASGGYSSLQCASFSLRWLLLLQSMGCRRVGFSSCSMWAQQLWLTGSRAQAQQLWCTSLVAPGHVGSSWTRDRTRVPCTDRQILNHCATREAPLYSLYQRILILPDEKKKKIREILSKYTLKYTFKGQVFEKSENRIRKSVKYFIRLHEYSPKIYFLRYWSLKRMLK